jgi:hypothetical protein
MAFPDGFAPLANGSRWLKVSQPDQEKKLCHSRLVSHNKILNLKHQITNKFQISIFNNQNIRQNCSAPELKIW